MSRPLPAVTPIVDAPSDARGATRAHSRADFRRAIARDELRLHAQPKVDLRTGEVAGLEALVRWQHPARGLLHPDDFLPDARDRGMMVAIGEWVLTTAIALGSRWRSARAGRPMRVWVNLATEQLVEGVDLCATIRSALDDGTITPACLGFEVTESTLLEDLPVAVEVLTTLRQMGFEIALDDFGTGYSSLWYLRELPVTAVKIDRSFVAGIGGSLADEAIVVAVIDLAHALGLRVVAEGVEEVHQAEALIRMGAERGQGFYFARPAEPDTIEPLLSLPWSGAVAPCAPRDADTRADALPGFGSPRARLLLSALDSAHDSVVVTSAGSTTCSVLANPIVYVNPAFESETGYAAGDVLGTTLDLMLPESDRARIIESIDARTADQVAVTAEWPHRRADGSTFPCEVTLSPVFDERGIHTHWLHVRRDLTRRRAAEAAEHRRLQLSGFAADLATRVLGVGGDEKLADLDDILASLGTLLDAGLVYFDKIDRDAGVVVPQASWTSTECVDCDAAPAVIDAAHLIAWISHLECTTALSEWRLTDATTPWMVELNQVFTGDSLDNHLYAPLHVSGRLVGVLGLANGVADRRWTSDETAAVQQVADAFANLLGRRQASDALLASEARLTAMLASIGDLLVVVDAAGRISYVNSRAEDIVGFAPAEVTGRDFLEFLHPDDRVAAIEEFTATLSGRDTRPVMELRVLHRDGHAVWFDVEMNASADPLVGGYMLSLRDVSVQRASQEGARRRASLESVVLDLSQWALEVASEDIIDGLHVHLGAMARALAADSAFAALLEGDCVRNIAGWRTADSPRLSFSFPAGESAVPAIVERYRTLAPLIVGDIEDHDEAWADEWRSFPVPDRSGLNVPLVSGGKCLGNIGVAMARVPRQWQPDEIALVRKVAETVAIIVARHRAEASLRTSEARLASLLDGSQDLVVVVDANGVITYANHAVERSLGHRRHDIIGLDVAAFVHPGDRSIAALRLEMLISDEPTPATTLRLVRSDGSIGWWEVTAGALETTGGDVVLTCREVTERLVIEIAAGTRVTHVRYAFDLAQSALDLGAPEFLLRLPDVCREMAAMLDADMVYVDRLDSVERRLVNIACCSRAAARPAIAVGEALSFDDIAEYVEMLRRPEPIVEPDLLEASDPWVLEKRRHLGGERSLMAMGMSAVGQLFGVLGVSMADRARVWSEDEVTLLGIVAETVAHVLERARLDEALRVSEARFRLLSETAADVVVLVDAGGAITYVSPSSFALLGLTPDELIGRTAASMIHPDFVGELLPILIQPRGTCSFTSDTQLVRADGTAVWVAASTSVVYDADSGRAIEFRSSLRDITDRKLLELALEQQALHDPLTGLANRELLQRNLAEATSGAQAGQLAVLLLDLDGFKEVNDTFGHAVGDVVLQTIAERLRELTRASDTLARTGGDEFVLLCPGVDEAAGVRVAERIVRAIGAPVLAGEVFVELGASVGVAHGAGESADSDRLLLDADRAMYAAKRAGRGCVRTATHVGLRA